jgi:hypothetical protein
VSKKIGLTRGSAQIPAEPERIVNFLLKVLVAVPVVPKNAGAGPVASSSFKPHFVVIAYLYCCCFSLFFSIFVVVYY